MSTGTAHVRCTKRSSRAKLATSGSIHVGFFFSLSSFFLSPTATLLLPFLPRRCVSIPKRGDSLSFSLFYYIPPSPFLASCCPLRLATDSCSGFLSRLRDVGEITRLFAQLPFLLFGRNYFSLPKKKWSFSAIFFHLANKNSSASRLTCEFVHLNAKYRSRIELELSRRHLARFYPRYLISPSRGYFKIAAGNHGLSWLDRWVLFNGSFALAREEVRRGLFLVFIFFSFSPGYWKEFPDNFQAGVKVSSLLTFWEQPTAVHL